MVVDKVSMKRFLSFIIAGVALPAALLAQESSLSTVSGEDLSSTSERQIMNALYGRLPGLQLFQNGSGYLPSSLTPTTTVRGQGSYSGNHTLFIVDGVERDPSEIEVGEVESVTVLKDAASLVLWGIRGADGAVVITTRRGKDQEPFRLRAQLRTGVQVPYGIPGMASPVNYANAMNEARSLDGLEPYFSASNIASIADGSSTIIPRTDWESLMLRKYGFANDINLSIDGSTRSTKYFVYANYNSNRGFLTNTGLTDNIDTQAAYYALKLRSNLDVKVTRYTDLVINLSARLQQEQGPQGGLDISSMYSAPTVGIPAMLFDKWARTNLIDNPVGSVLGSGNMTRFGRSLLGDIAIKQSLSMILPGLRAEVRVSYDNASLVCDRKNFTYSYYTLSPLYDTAGNISDYSVSTFGNDTEIAFATWLQSQYMRLNGWAGLGWDGHFGKNNISADFRASREMYKLTGAGNMFKHQDYILSIKYDYDGKYLVNAALNASGSSLLTTGDKFRLYPAGSVAWVVSKEDFMSGSSFMDFLKVKASAGLVGMDANLVYDMDKQFNGSGNSYIFTFGSTQYGAREGDLPSVGVRPETDLKIDAGAEFHMPWGLSGEVTGFYNRRTGLRALAGNTTSGVLGIGLSDSFTGVVSNRGVEGALDWEGKIGPVSIDIGGTVSFARSRIEHLEEEYHPNDYQYEAGGSVGRIFALVSDGFYEASDFNADGSLKAGVPESSFSGSVRPGDVKYKDLSGDGIIDNYDYTWLKTPALPELYYGFHIGASWNGISLSALFQGTGDWTAVTNLPSVYQPLYGGDKNVSEYYLTHCWRDGADNAGALYPRLTTLENKNNFLMSDVWTANGKYLKLRELELSYSFPSSLISKIRLTGATVFFRGNNLLSFDGIKILDPEYISLEYPRARSYMFGIKLQF